MADEAFALSPISARASLPSEEDYEAISQAFMETSRGRWFLGEYARRNRNADTRMVLDAVARIEETLAAQKSPAPESGLPEALAAIRRAVDQAEAAAAVERLALEENLAPISKGVRIIREISWQWREIGADRSSSQAAEEARASPASAARDEAPAAVAETARAVSTADNAEAAMDMPANAVVETAEAVETAVEAGDVTVEAADADDEALLDLIALEMSAPDPDDIDEAPTASPGEIRAEIRSAEPRPAEPRIVAETARPIGAPAAQASLEPSLEASLEPSLGSSLIANGIVRRPRASDADPLAPIRRMSQAEKIAFFS
jgi:hypothetical protein